VFSHAAEYWRIKNVRLSGENISSFLRLSFFLSSLVENQVKLNMRGIYPWMIYSELNYIFDYHHCLRRMYSEYFVHQKIMNLMKVILHIIIVIVSGTGTLLFLFNAEG